MAKKKIKVVCYCRVSTSSKEQYNSFENQKDFYSQPVLSDVPKPKEEFKSSHLVDENSKYCQTCGAKIDGDSKFCTNCGAKLEDMITCPKCGASVSGEDKFCTNCGNKL